MTPSQGSYTIGTGTFVLALVVAYQAGRGRGRVEGAAVVGHAMLEALGRGRRHAQARAMTPSATSYSVGRRLVDIARLLDGARVDLAHVSEAAAAGTAVGFIYEAEAKLHDAARCLGWRP